MHIFAAWWLEFRERKEKKYLRFKVIIRLWREDLVILILIGENLIKELKYIFLENYKIKLF